MDGQNRAAFTSAPCSLHRRTGSTYTVRPHGKFSRCTFIIVYQQPTRSSSSTMTFYDEANYMEHVLCAQGEGIVDE